MVDKQTYFHAKSIVEQYEYEQRQIKKYKGKSKCPFCGGTKTTPFVSTRKSQNCTQCDKNGMINNSRLVEMDLIDFIEK